MPTLFYFNGLRFYFFSSEHEPIHIHVESADGRAKFNLIPEIALVENKGLKPRQIRESFNAIEENYDVIIERWNEFYSK